MLASALSDAGLDLSDHTLTQANFTSETGVLVGITQRSAGHLGAFIATLP